MKRKTIILLLMVFIISMFILSIFNPMRMNCNVIRNNVLKITPIGSNIDDIMIAIEEQKWDFQYKSDIGFRMGPEDTTSGNLEYIGVKHIRANIGSYRNFFVTDVCVYWGFDEFDNLIDVYVVKYTDAF